jgi:hypothetical protein
LWLKEIKSKSGQKLLMQQIKFSGTFFPIDSPETTGWRQAGLSLTNVDEKIDDKSPRNHATFSSAKKKGRKE